jgi:hypothetical protein
MGKQQQPSIGLGVDASGGPVVDPTQNVLDLVAAAIQRQDDLREVESRHVREIAQLRAEYQQELRELETQRIDAIREVDTGAVARAADVQALQAQTLAKQVADSAEAMRVQVAATATAGTVALSAALDPIKNDIQDLRRAQYEAQGQKAQVIEHRDTGGETRGWIVVAIAVAAVSSSVILGVVGIAVTLILKG